MAVELAVGEGLWVAGPARVRVVSGVLLASGYTIEAGEEAIVRSTRGFTFYALKPSRVEVVTGRGGGYTVVREGYDVVEAWAKLLDRLESEGAKRIAVVGPIESGKSTLTAWIRNRLGVCVVEADIGQNELGAPGFVTLSRNTRGRVLTLQDLGFEEAFLVGHVSADKALDLTVSAVVRASRRCPEGFVVDTDGYVAGRGMVYKAAMLEALDVDHVVATDASIAKYLERRGFQVVTAAKPRLPRERSRADRRAFRERLYTSLFTASKTITLQGVSISNTCNVKSREKDMLIFDCDGLEVVESKRRPQDRPWVRPGWARGLLAGLRLTEGYDVPALIEQLDAAEGRVVARVPSRFADAASKARIVSLGWVRLSENYSEELLAIAPHPLPLLASSTGAYHRSRRRR